MCLICTVAVLMEAFRGRGDAAWEAQRTESLMRFNERRTRFEKELRCPMILLLPAGAMREIAWWAPDMWHIRLHAEVLGLGGAGAQSMAPEIVRSAVYSMDSTQMKATPVRNHCRCNASSKPTPTMIFHCLHEEKYHDLQRTHHRAFGCSAQFVA
jgi:hypothetical protein